MDEVKAPTLPKWPFLLGDALLIGAAIGIYSYAQKPFGAWELSATTGCIALAALFGCLPFILEFRALARMAEAGTLAISLERLGNVDAVADRIAGATSQWQTIHEEAGKSTAAAKQLTDRMVGELKAFTEFMERANSTEKATLRLEVEKLRRSEGDWLQVLVRMLDHVFALHRGAVMSGQQNVIQQVDRFQHACCDVARRVGLAPFIATPAEKFNPERHQLADEKAETPADAVVQETLATGYTYQGRIVRPALVKLQTNGAPPQSEGTTQGNLPLSESSA